MDEHVGKDASDHQKIQVAENDHGECSMQNARLTVRRRRSIRELDVFRVRTIDTYLNENEEDHRDAAEDEADETCN